MEAIATLPPPASKKPEAELSMFFSTVEMGEWAAAMAKAQGMMENAAKSANNPHFGSKYADLASVMDVCRGPLAANDIALTQPPATTKDGRVRIVTMLLHKSGQCLTGTLEMPVNGQTAQNIGSAITYGRRYSLMGMLGLAGDDDDDGNAASGQPSGQGQPQENPEDRKARWEKEKAQRAAEREAKEKAKAAAAESAKAAQAGTTPPPVAEPTVVAPAKMTPAIRGRAMKVWELKKSQGMAKEEFAEWTRKALRLEQAKSFESWTADDVERLESELHRELAGPGPDEPGSDG